MEAEIRAAIELDGPVLRYAEVELYGGSVRRLLRLGSCDFDFNAAELLYQSGQANSLDILAEALTDVFQNSKADELALVVHPSQGLSFHSPVASSADVETRKEQLLHEAALLTDEESFPGGLEVFPQVLYQERLNGSELHDWIYAVTLPAKTSERLEEALVNVPIPTQSVAASPKSAIRIATRLEERELVPAGEKSAELDRDEPLFLTIGWYDAHTEYAVSFGSQWIYGHHTDYAESNDSAYFALDLVKQLDGALPEIEAVYLYGPNRPDDAADPFRQILNLDAQLLDPLPIVDVNRGSLAKDFDPSLYVPCLGALL